MPMGPIKAGAVVPSTGSLIKGPLAEIDHGSDKAIPQDLRLEHSVCCQCRPELKKDEARGGA